MATITSLTSLSDNAGVFTGGTGGGSLTVKIAYRVHTGLS